MNAELAHRGGRVTKLAALAAASLLAVTFPLWAADLYQLHLAALIAAFWILIGGLNLVIGYTGQLSIGHVGLLAVGAYTFAILSGTLGVHPAVAVAASGILCGLFGLLLGLPSLRLPGFYFAMATMAVALMVGEFIMANDELTGGGIGVLLVEHHTDFVFRVCDRVTALDVGKMIRHGTPAEVRSDPEVIRIYLGA